MESILKRDLCDSEIPNLSFPVDEKEGRGLEHGHIGTRFRHE